MNYLRKGSAIHTKSLWVFGKARWLVGIILSLLVFAWGLPQVKGALNAISAPAFPVPGLHLMVQRVPPVVAANVSARVIGG